MTAWRTNLILVPLAALCVSGASEALGQAAGTALRDPTEPPATYSASVGNTAAPVDRFKPGHLVTVAGVRYLVWNSRRYVVGNSIDGSRIERISETEVWLRNADGLRKYPLFTGIEKRLSSSTAPSNPPMRNGKNGPTK